jgi:uncharacterized protein involved in exopolysaccharide biosynthesis
MAAAGLAVGVGVYIKAPPPYRASASVLLTQPAAENPQDAVQAEVTLGRTRAVAAGAMHRLDLTESVTAFLSSYTVMAITDRVVLITADAPSSGQAVRVAAALATSFLQFRNAELQAQQQIQATSLNQQIAKAKQALAATISRITDASGHPPSSSRRAELRRLRRQRDRAAVTLAELQQSAATYAVTTASSIAGSGVLDRAAPLPRSRLRTPALYGIAGLIIGLVLGLGIVIVGNPASR